MVQEARRDVGSISGAVEGFRTSGVAPAARRVCWVTDEMVELFKNGGAGTVVSGFVDALLAAGHPVSVLYTSGIDQNASDNAGAIAALRSRGVTLTFLQDVKPLSGSLTAQSYAVHEWLKTQTFDIVHFHDFNARGFAACTAKRMGLAHRDTLLCLTNFGSTRWAWECMEHFLQSPDELERDWIERKAIENADAVLCHSRHMANWLGRNRYKLPAATYVQPSIVPFTPSHDGPCGRTDAPIREIAFFGRQEVRKGMRVHVAAIDRLAARHPELRFSFVGKFSEIDYEHSGGFVFSRLAKIPNDIRMLANLSRDDALRYLKRPDVLAVMPSVDDNFPGTVIEAIREGIEFVASDRGGIPEIVHPDDQPARLFELTSAKLAAAVERVMAERPARPRLAFDPVANIAAWMDWHALVPVHAPVEPEPSSPLVSVCVVHYNRPRLLAMTMEGLRGQTYRNFEVILVDDGSTTQEARDYVEHLETADLGFPLRVVRTPDVRLGAARNAGATVAGGEYLVFNDDDNVPRPNLIEVLVQAAQRQRLDVATCYAYVFFGDGRPVERGTEEVGYLPTGGPLALGLVRNVFGDANAIVRRSTFEALGGFDPTPGVGAEDWEFFARAMLAGHRLEAVPQALYWYRQHENQLSIRPHSTHLYYERLLQTYWAALKARPDPEIEDALRIYMGRFAYEMLRLNSWHQLGNRYLGEYQRQLVPLAYKAEESYRLLAVYCTKLGRFRDAASLLLQQDDVHARLLGLERDIAATYRERTEDFPQGYYESPPSPYVPMLPSTLSGVRGACADLPAEYLGFDGRRILLHPITERRTVAVIPGGLPIGQTDLSVCVRVDHESGPSVTFTIAVAENDDAADYSSLPQEALLAVATVTASPADGRKTLNLKVPDGYSEPLTILLSTEVGPSNAFAWAFFERFAVRRDRTPEATASANGP